MMCTLGTKTLQLRKIDPENSMVNAHFFNSALFFKTKSFQSIGWQLTQDKPIAQVFFSIEDGKAISGRQATFGSFDVADEVTSEKIGRFLKGAVKELEAMVVKEIEVRHYPSYFSQSKLVTDALQAAGFEISVRETNQHIPVSEKPFDQIAKRNELKKIRQSEEAGFIFKIVDSPSIKRIYDLVVDTRARKGYPVSMSFEALQQAIQNAPENYLLFTLWDKYELIAVSVSVVVTNELLYNFYHADAFAYRQKSPLAYLVKCIYEYSQQHGFKFLDLGISSEQGKLNKGLFTFKQNLGAVVSDKITYRLTL